MMQDLKPKKKKKRLSSKQAGRNYAAMRQLQGIEKGNEIEMLKKIIDEKLVFWQAGVDHKGGH